ncbi:response regulator [Acanthopleuribacter pedis]|uniref:Response regulator transcription factor n=1 Tax=Acanthopleuribacter pedis TaxID=442870 RepID=A0A8J7QJ11_9BACT|nr:response regulator transcription factor [Acanthopleuribacter pedis]
MNILIVEDEPGLQLGLSDLFEDAGYQTKVCDRGKQVLGHLRSFQPNLIILDLGLPDMDGTRVLSQIQSEAKNIPVLILSARANDADIVLGFKLGAYDYVTKPFSPTVLLARTEALLQRITPEEPAEEESRCLALQHLRVDFERYEATRNGDPLHLTTREFELLSMLHQHQGRPVHRNDILDEVWGLDSEAGPRTVDTHIAQLRKKIERNPDRPTIILSQRGIGYKLAL